MEPIVSSSGRTTQLRYELPHRVYDSKIYPVSAPNGSTILLYGHESGVGILWRGGRALKKETPAAKVPAKSAKVNGTSNAIVIIDSDDEAPAEEELPVAEFEDEEEELEPDQPYPSIVQHIRLPLNTSVFHIAVPPVPVSSLRAADTTPAIFSKKIVFTIACADSTVRLITLPLNPPSEAAKQKSSFGESITKVHGQQSISKGITMTWTARDEQGADDNMIVDGESEKKTDEEGRGFDVLIASHSTEIGGLLRIWRLELSDTALKKGQPLGPHQTLNLPKSASRIAFSIAQYPKPRHSQLLITDSAGIAKIYDPLTSTPSARKSRADRPRSGVFIKTFRATFESVKASAHTPAILATRKAIIDAAWTSDGQHIVALLADGEWGVWDVDRSGPSPPADATSFSLRGFVGTIEKETNTGGTSSPKRGSRNSLAPMTPNTRRRKEDALFQGTSSSAAAVKGGLSVASTVSTDEHASVDSVIIWYGPDCYRIADLTKFWSRAASAGSLPGPGPQVQSVSLYGEVITSVSQFRTTTQASRMAIPRDCLISAEHRLIITANTSQPQGRDIGSMFAQEQAEEENSRRLDQALLSQGELDLGGMDRLLDEMEGSGTISKTLTLGGAGPRKVLFAP